MKGSGWMAADAAHSDIHTHTVSWTVNQSFAIMGDQSDPGNAICWCWKGWEIKNLFSYSLYLSSIWQQPVTVYETSALSTHHTCLHRCSVSHNHLRYHITTSIGIGTRIGIGVGKKYRVSEVSVNPGIGLSLICVQALEILLQIRHPVNFCNLLEKDNYRPVTFPTTQLTVLIYKNEEIN